MFQVLLRFRNIKIFTGKFNDSSVGSTLRNCSSSTGDLEHGSRENNASQTKPANVAQEPNAIKTELTLKQLVKKQRAELNPHHVKLETLPREELISLIRRLSETNKQLVAIIQKEGEDETMNQTDPKKIRFDSSAIHKRHILLRIYYLGWNFGGFVVQNNLANTIEQHLFSALTRTFLIESRQSSNYHLCGRTDKGVSAFEQVISIDVRSRIKPDDQLSQAGVEDELSYCRILNSALPRQIRAISWRPLMSDGYSARFDCQGRAYKYFFHRGQLNIESMQEACQYLIGTHDFRNFCKNDVKSGIVDYVRRLDYAQIRPAAQNHEKAKEFDVFYLEIKGLSFLWHMIRYIVSVLMMIGKGHESPDIVKDLLDVEVNDRKPDYHMASQVPLNLFKCSHREEIPEASEERNIEMLNKWVYDERTMNRLITDLQNEWCDESIKSTMLYDMLKVLRSEYIDRFPEASVIPIHKNDRWKNYATILDRQKCPSLEERIQLLKRRLEKSE